MARNSVRRAKAKRKEAPKSNWEGKNSTWVSGRTNKIIAPKTGSNLRAGKDYDSEVKRQKAPLSKTNRQKLVSGLKNLASKVKVNNSLSGRKKTKVTVKNTDLSKRKKTKVTFNSSKMRR